MPTANNSLLKLLDCAGQFVSKQNGNWNHDEWEGFLATATKVGFELDCDEARRNLGNILEASKFFLSTMPAACAPKKAASKAKAAPKKKS